MVPVILESDMSADGLGFGVWRYSFVSLLPSGGVSIEDIADRDHRP